MNLLLLQSLLSVVFMFVWAIAGMIVIRARF
jgi:hypothetical protein